jgi:hypothetical protein
MVDHQQQHKTKNCLLFKTGCGDFPILGGMGLYLGISSSEIGTFSVRRGRDRDDEGRVLQRDREDQNIDFRINICYDIRTTSITRKETILKKS